MKFLFYTFLAGSLSMGSLVAKPLANYVTDDVEMIWRVRSFSDLREQWDRHPFASLVSAPEVQAHFMEDSDDDDSESFTDVMQNEFGLTYDELFSLFPGEAVFAVYNMVELLMEKTELPDGVLMVEYAGDEAKLHELMDIQFKRNAKAQAKKNPLVEHTMIRETFMGETLHFDETYDGEKTYIEDGYALVDGVFILARPEARLRDAVEAIKAGADSPISAAGRYRRMEERSGRGDLRMFFNLTAVVPKLEAEWFSAPLEGTGWNSMGITSESLRKALNLGNLEAVYLSADFIDDGLSAAGGILYRENTGVVSLLGYEDGYLPEAAYVPGNAFTASVSLLNISTVLNSLEGLLGAASPNASGMLDAQLQTVRANTGVDLRAALLENLGGPMVAFSVLDPGAQAQSVAAEPDQVFLFEVKDSLSLAQAVAAFTDMAPQVKPFILEQEYMGETLYTVRGRPHPENPDIVGKDFNYVLTRSKLIVCIGPVGLLQQVLSRMESSQEGFWQEPAIERLVGRLETSGPVERSFIDLEAMIEPWIRTVLLSDTPAGVGRLPSHLQVPFRALWQLHKEPDGFFGRGLVIKKEATR